MIEGDISIDIHIIGKIIYLIIQRRIREWVHLAQNKILLKWNMKC